MKTIYDIMRPGTRNQWKRKKKQLMNLGLRSGEWHTLSFDHLTALTMRDGMTVQNVSGRPALYRVVKTVTKTVLLNLRTDKVRELDNPRKYKWVRS